MKVSVFSRSEAGWSFDTTDDSSVSTVAPKTPYLSHDSTAEVEEEVKKVEVEKEAAVTLPSTAVATTTSILESSTISTTKVPASDNDTAS